MDGNRGGVRPLMKADLEHPGQQIGIDHNTAALFGIHNRAIFGRNTQKVLICILLIFQAAHQPAAGAADLDRVEGNSLLLRHFDGDGLKIA